MNAASRPVSVTYLTEDLRRVGFRDAVARRPIYAAASSPGRISGFVGPGLAPGMEWLAGDHPTRMNLILEQLGRPERIAE